MEQKNKTICIIVPYFGKWPKYFSYFLESCKFNSKINWLFYTDCKIPEFYPKNVKFICATLNDFDKLASQKINLKINITYSYKLCDFKPIYGHIFEEYLKDFDFWGYSDIDLIFGNIRKFLTDEILENNDIITTYKNFVAGPLTIFKNTDKTRFLYQKSNDFKKVLTSQEIFNFDESNFVFNKNIFLTNERIGKNGIESITHLIANNKDLKIFAEDLILNIKPEDKGEIKFNNGKLIDISSGSEIFAVHFLFIRVNKEIYLPKIKKEGNFLISSCGIYYNKLSSLKRFFIFKKINILNILKVRVGIFLQKFFPKIYYFVKKQK